MNIDTILKEIFSFRATKRRENIDDLKLIYDLLGKPCKNNKIIHNIFVALVVGVFVLNMIQVADCNGGIFHLNH